MKFLRHIRSRSRHKPPRGSLAEAVIYGDAGASGAGPADLPPAGVVAALPAPVLARVFAHVCPHAGDEAYTTCEEAGVPEGRCPLCDARDLAGCARVCRGWRGAAESTLYHSIRLDAVHYCEREHALTERRKRRSFFDRNGDPGDPAQARLALLVRTARDRPDLARRVGLLKLPYMTRAACQPELAQAVARLPALRYLDLPDAVFGPSGSSGGAPGEAALRTELERRCPNLRRVQFGAGAELEACRLAAAGCWARLEILELDGLRLDAPAVRAVLAAFPALREVRLARLDLDDALFAADPSAGAPFPPVRTLALDELDRVTAGGLTTHLARPDAQNTLTHLSLAAVDGVSAHELHRILTAAPRLRSLAFRATVARAFPPGPVPPLASPSLASLDFEVLPDDPSSPSAPEESYYAYLARALLGGHLPALARCFAYSAALPDQLLFPAPALSPPPPFGRPGGSSVSPSGSLSGGGLRTPSPHRGLSAASASLSSLSLAASSGSGGDPFATFPLRAPADGLPGLAIPLRLYTRPARAPELEWSLTAIDPPRAANGRVGSFRATRPLSTVGPGPDRAAARGSSPGSTPGRRFDDDGGGAEWETGGNGGPGRGGAGAGEAEAVLAGQPALGGFLAVPVKGVGRDSRRPLKKGSWDSEWMG